jgi:hypothetical protein
MISSTLVDIALISADRWQAGVSRRAFMSKVLRIVLRLQKLEGEPTSVGIAVWAVWLVLPVLAERCFKWTFGVSPLALIPKL